MALVDRLRAASGVAVDTLYGEPVEITARIAQPKRPIVADPDRQPVTITARFVLEPHSMHLEGERRGTELASFVSLAGEEALLIVRDATLAGIPFTVKKDDLVRLLDPKRADLPAYAIGVVRRGGLGRHVFGLTRVSA